jgi:hypothetical protein
LSLIVAGAVQAQSPCEEALEIARREYDQGYFDEASFRLYACLGQHAFDVDREKEAYLLLGKIHYANLDMEKARDSVRTLLERDPALELNPSDYKPGFVDLVNEVMKEIEIQESPSSRRSGFWFSLGIGPADGSIQCDCPLPSDDVWRGGGAGSFYLSGGGTVNDNLQLGAELSSWRRVEDNRSSTISLLSFVAKYYPGRAGQFFLKGGLGLGGARLEASSQNVSFERQSGGLGLQFGLGYDFVLGKARKMAITPSLNLSAISAESESFVLENNRFGGGKNPSFFQIGVGVSWL